MNGRPAKLMSYKFGHGYLSLIGDALTIPAVPLRLAWGKRREDENQHVHRL